MKYTHKFFLFFGINFKIFLLTFLRLPRYIFSLYHFLSVNYNSNFKIKSIFPCIHDVFEKSGNAKGHYFYQDLHVAKMININKPVSHFDIGSRIDGFVAHVASFRKINVFDIRILDTFDDNVEFHQLDLMNEIPPKYIDITDSLSCLHTLEHFGLGRYGDKIDPDGYIKGLNNMTLLIKQYGVFYLSVPIGEQRIEFNAHRVFSVQYLFSLVSKDFEIINFSFVDDNGDLFINVDLNEDLINRNFNCYYGCGILTLRKK